MLVEFVVGDLSLSISIFFSFSLCLSLSLSLSLSLLLSLFLSVSLMYSQPLGGRGDTCDSAQFTWRESGEFTPCAKDCEEAARIAQMDNSASDLVKNSLLSLSLSLSLSLCPSHSLISLISLITKKELERLVTVLPNITALFVLGIRLREYGIFAGGPGTNVCGSSPTDAHKEGVPSAHLPKQVRVTAATLTWR